MPGPTSVYSVSAPAWFNRDSYCVVHQGGARPGTDIRFRSVWPVLGKALLEPLSEDISFVLKEEGRSQFPRGKLNSVLVTFISDLYF